jgi:hypothetical protein
MKLDYLQWALQDSSTKHSPLLGQEDFSLISCVYDGRENFKESFFIHVHPLTRTFARILQHILEHLTLQKVSFSKKSAIISKKKVSQSRSIIPRNIPCEISSINVPVAQVREDFRTKEKEILGEGVTLSDSPIRFKPSVLCRASH